MSVCQHEVLLGIRLDCAVLMAPMVVARTIMVYLCMHLIIMAIISDSAFHGEQAQTSQTRTTTPIMVTHFTPTL